MSLKIVKESLLSLDLIKEINNLYKLCNSYDKSGYVFDIDDDFKKEDDVNTFLLYKDDLLVSSISMFAPSKDEAEIVALTLPEHRRLGFFTLLLKEAIIEIKRREIKSILFVSDSVSNDGVSFCNNFNSKYEFSEYLLEFKDDKKLLGVVNQDISISISTVSEKEELTLISSKAFKSELEASSKRLDDILDGSKRQLYTIKFKSIVVGMIGIFEESSRFYIFGFCIDPEYQHRGIGKYVLSSIVQQYLTRNKKIVLEVLCHNVSALTVYQNIGFFTKAEFKYFRYRI